MEPTGRRHPNSKGGGQFLLAAVAALSPFSTPCALAALRRVGKREMEEAGPFCFLPPALSDALPCARDAGARSRALRTLYAQALPQCSACYSYICVGLTSEWLHDWSILEHPAR